jgi:hypothetical protein
MNTTNFTSRPWQPVRRFLPIVAPALAFGAALATASAVFAGQVIGDNVCMDDLFPGTLNCSANDVTIASASVPEGTTCQEDTTFTLTADFLVVLSGKGQTRYDLGLYFDIKGEPDNDGARGGFCSLNAIQQGEPDYLQLDPSPPDICGDINNTNSPLETTITIPGVLCQDTDGDGFLNLPNCTSWRQPGSNGVCDSPLDAFPGSPSKCNCDDTFNVPVQVESASAVLIKRSTQAVVTYETSVTNSSESRTVRLDALCDDIYGTIDGSCPSGGLGIQSTTCDLPQTLAAGGSYSCTFDVRVAAPGSATAVTDIVTGTLVDTGNNQLVTPAPFDEATVTVNLPATP